MSQGYKVLVARKLFYFCPKKGTTHPTIGNMWAAQKPALLQPEWLRNEPAKIESSGARSRWLGNTVRAARL